MLAGDESSPDDTATYLKDLRTQRQSRPSGSRPAPPSKFGSLRGTETAPSEPAIQTKSHDDRPTLPSSNSTPIMAAQPTTLSHKRTGSNRNIRSPFAGRPIARPPSAMPEPEPGKEAASKQRPTSLPYLENGMRWMEKQEARSLRMALEDMDLEEERRIHTAAQDEAAELVWRHQNPGAVFANPDASKVNPDLAKSGAEAKKDYREHMRRGSYARNHSREAVPLAESRKASGEEKVSFDISTIAMRGSYCATDEARMVSLPTGSTSRKSRTPSGKSYGGLAEAVEKDIATAYRRTSGDSKRIMSGDKKMFMHRNDRIWEDSQEHSSPPLQQMLGSVPESAKPAATLNQPPSFVRKNPFARVRMQSQARLEHSPSRPVVPVAEQNSVGIQRNPQSQSRNAFYTSNPVSLPPTPPASGNQPNSAGIEDDVSPKATPTKDGKEIRSDELRAATGKLRKDRSPNLPQPTVVSEKAGRPIVSFKKDWAPKEVVLEEVRSTEAAETARSARSSIGGPSRPLPKFTVDETLAKRPPPNLATSDPGTRPPIPTIIVPDDPDVPTVVLPEEPDFADTVPALSTIPTFNVSPPATNTKNNPPSTFSFPPPGTKAASRPLPTRPTPLHHAATSPLPQRSSPHSTPYSRKSGVLCAHCALPIAGRILSAAGERLHPQCFTCHACNTNLELVAFYPEPDAKRSERLARISARQNGEDVPIPEGTSTQEALDRYQRQEIEDGDGSLRFYCHLDFHELFSPRCKTCKTPIEGEVIVACGAEYHSGHFFCAQCGDPFDARTPFVEKDGWAWCLGCHTKRYNSKCRGCKKPVEGVVVKALGADWCDGCFFCVVSVERCLLRLRLC